MEPADILVESPFHEVADVFIQEICYVKPPPKPTAAAPAHYYGQHLFLNSLDLFWQEFHYNRRLLFYRSTAADESDRLVAALKSSLSDALFHFYPLAGRLFTEADGRSCILCEDQGVQFVVATTAATLPLDNFPPSPFFDKLVQLSDVDLSKLNELPLLSVQVTKFRCGGISVGYAHSHVVADGYSMWHFMKSWAEMARGEKMPSLAPSHDRTVFRVVKPLPEIAGNLYLPPAIDDTEFEIRQKRSPPQLTERLFHISDSAIDALKRRAGGGISSYAAISAHWWKHVMAARHLDDGTRVLFAVLADMRRRVTPPLPASYFGNAIVFYLAETTYGELRRMGVEDAAALIAGAARKCDEKRMWAFIHWLEMNGNMMGRRRMWRGSTMNVASSPKFDVYGVDFGWGAPAAVRTAKIKGDGEMVLFPGRGGGGIDVCMALERSSMERLLQPRRGFVRLGTKAAADDGSDDEGEECR